MASARGCGTRKAGGVYLTVGTSPFGKPLEEFICDPPRIIPYREMGISPVGIKLIKFPGRPVYDVIDWIGSEYYPNVADVIEEARSFLQRGENPISRRIARNEKFELLSPGSMLIMMHARAHITNFAEVDRAIQGASGEQSQRDMLACATGKLGHDYPAPVPPVDPQSGADEMCVRLWWHDLIKGEEAPGSPGVVRRTFGSTAYSGWSSPLRSVGHEPAIFAAFPIAGLEVIRERDGSVNEETVDAVSKSSLTFEVLND